ncbi:MAG TPA: methyltransferase domain-containing protein, partial [Desulfosarcina sp.]|nr:methyltransferase domain-containing protein [Desulfosarcina sp.]
MKPILSSEQRRRIASGIRDRYARVAAGPDGHFAYPTGREGLERLQYDQMLLAKLSHEVASSYCGVGNPFALGEIHPGERVLDVGCGAGVDTILAGFLVGPKGLSAGVDIVPEMMARAHKNRETTGVDNVVFQNASGEALP